MTTQTAGPNKKVGLDRLYFFRLSRYFRDVFGEQGHPVRATISEMGPLLISRILNLNDAQAGVMALVFKIADDNGLLLLDLKDLQAMLQHVGDSAKDFQTPYGNISPASIGDDSARVNCYWSSRAATNFSASPRLTSTICCKPIPTAAGW